MAKISILPLSCGHFTLPLASFLHPAPSSNDKSTVPSLSFLITHTAAATTRILFDLSLRRSTTLYPPPIQQHIQNRQPYTPTPDVVEVLATTAQLKPADVDFVIFSHVHWDHVGYPKDFPRAIFVVGNGSLDLLDGKIGGGVGGHAHFEKDLLPRDEGRVVELKHPLDAHDKEGGQGEADAASPGEVSFSRPWVPHPDSSLRPYLPVTIDLFGDGSVYVVDAPGHLPGHINLLVRRDAKDDSSCQSDVATEPVSGGRWVYLAGDACHDRRILSGEAQIAEWDAGDGRVGCIHLDKAAVEKTIGRIRALEQMGVEVVLAHDGEWERRWCEMGGGKLERCALSREMAATVERFQSPRS